MRGISTRQFGYESGNVPEEWTTLTFPEEKVEKGAPADEEYVYVEATGNGTVIGKYPSDEYSETNLWDTLNFTLHPDLDRPES